MVVVREVGTLGRRKHRRPRYHFQIKHRPFQIQPFFIAPVLPGETMKLLMLQSRAVTDPIKNPLVGWWLEYYFFYVKHSDLDGRDDFQEMMLQKDYNLAAYKTAANAKTYHLANTIDWASLCLKRVVEEYFRDEDEAWNNVLIDGIPVAAVGERGWMDSLTNEDDLLVAEQAELTVGADDKVTGQEVEALLMNWQWLRQMNLTDMSYEDYLATFGVQPKPEDSHRPELVRFAREWQYPSNTVDPTTGTPSSAVSWAMAERADKNRFFREPGFLFGVTVSRPKVYFKNVGGTLTGLLDDAMSWLPAILSHDPATSLNKFAAGSAPITVSTDGYYIDLKDLYLYGEQFLNYAIDAASNQVDLPSATLQSKYPSATDSDGFFKTSGTNNVRQDGIVTLDIATLLTDTSPQGIRG